MDTNAVIGSNRVQSGGIYSRITRDPAHQSTESLQFRRVDRFVQLPVEGGSQRFFCFELLSGLSVMLLLNRENPSVRGTSVYPRPLS